MLDFILIKNRPFQKKEIRYITTSYFDEPISEKYDEDLGKIPTVRKYNMVIIFTDSSTTNVTFNDNNDMLEELERINKDLVNEKNK